MLLAAGAKELPFNIIASEYLNLSGNKFSKSKGRIISVNELLQKYQPDSIRYALTSLAPETGDVDFHWEDFHDRINNELVANWGNVVQRVLTFTFRKRSGIIPTPDSLQPEDHKILDEIKCGFNDIGLLYEQARFRTALLQLRDLSRRLNQYVSTMQPWQLIKTDEKRTDTVLFTALQCIDWLKTLWSPILPFSAQKIHDYLGNSGQLSGQQYIQEIIDERGQHQILRYRHDKACNVWEPSKLQFGQLMKEPEILFKKI